MGVLDAVNAADYPPTAVTCPRCGNAAAQQFAGPCESCRAELRARFAPHARNVADAEFEPKMNVTPNAVALKDD